LGKRVVIIGGGFAGLAAGVALSEGGSDVVLLERRKHLGGRAYSFLDTATGDIVDNGQHLFMSCYRNTISFLDKIGCLHKLAFQAAPRVDFLDRENGFSSFACPPLPAPLHAICGIFRMKGLTLGDKLRAINVGRALGKKETHVEDRSVSAWLSLLGQSQRIRERFWYPMTIATLNESPEVASARMLKRVLEQAFGGGYSDSRLGLSTVGLSQLYTEGARDFIESRGGQVRTAADVAQLTLEGDLVRGCELKNGECLEADCYISAVPPSALGRLLPHEVRRRYFPGLLALTSSPIVSMNLWFDRPVIHREFVGLLGTRVQWLFNKDLICRSGKRSNHIAIVISAAYQYVDWTREELVQLARRELELLIPEVKEAKLLHSRVVKERAATISHTIESDRIRPGAQTRIGNLILAGDWTDTGLPATIESAVMSGHRAAEVVANLDLRSGISAAASVVGAAPGNQTREP
jgi:squalene-associated FAD-dependent desaturase